MLIHSVRDKIPLVLLMYYSSLFQFSSRDTMRASSCCSLFPLLSADVC